jgi:hypothetical protein
MSVPNGPHMGGPPVPGYPGSGNPGNNGGGTTAPAQSPSMTPSIKAAISSYNAALSEQNAAWSSLQNALHDLTGKSIGEQFMLAMMLIMPDVMKVQGDQLSVTAAKMNIGSVLSGAITSITNDLTALEGPNGASDTAAAQNLVSELNHLKTLLSPAPAWMSGSTATSIIDACNQFLNMFGSNATPATIAAAINSWATNPTATNSTYPGQGTGQQNIQALNGFLSTENNAVNGYSQMQNNAMQFQNNNISQLLSSLKALWQSIATENAALVKNSLTGG